MYIYIYIYIYIYMDGLVVCRLTMAFTGNFVYMAHHFRKGLIGKDGGLSTLCHSCRMG